jgi:hypothetical protein
MTSQPDAATEEKPALQTSADIGQEETTASNTQMELGLSDSEAGTEGLSHPPDQASRKAMDEIPALLFGLLFGTALFWGMIATVTVILVRGLPLVENNVISYRILLIALAAVISAFVFLFLVVSRKIKIGQRA